MGQVRHLCFLLGEVRKSVGLKRCQAAECIENTLLIHESSNYKLYIRGKISSSNLNTSNIIIIFHFPIAHKLHKDHTLQILTVHDLWFILFLRFILYYNYFYYQFSSLFFAPHYLRSNQTPPHFFKLGFGQIFFISVPHRWMQQSPENDFQYIFLKLLEMNPGWNQPNQGQTPPQGWGNQIPPTGWGGQQAWGNPQQPNQIYNNADNQWSQWGQQNNQVYSANPGFVIQAEQQGNSKSWNQHSGWGIQLEKSEPTNVPFFQMPQQAPQQAYQQSYSLAFSPVIANQGTTAENQPATKNSLKLDLSKQYIICSALDTAMVADVNKDEKNKNQLMLWKKHGESNQRYKLVPVNDRFMIVNMASNLALEIQKSSPTRGALIIANTQIGSPNQLWELSQSKQTDGGYFIRTFCGKCWDLCEWKTSAGTPIIQYDFNGGRNQVWHLKPF